MNQRDWFLKEAEEYLRFLPPSGEHRNWRQLTQHCRELRRLLKEAVDLLKEK